MKIDLNCDLGEGSGRDAVLLPWITSANICCGAHAGGSEISRETLRLAKEHQVVVGAHPGYPDRENFGRLELDWAPAQIFEEMISQVGLLRKWADEIGVPLRYIKPHGGLYHQVCREDRFAEPFLDAAVALDLGVMGLPNSRLQALAQDRIPFYAEGFADRRYRTDGSLVPRNQPDAFVENPDEAVRQIQWLIQERNVQSLCVHGDHPQALEFVQALRQALEAQGISIQPFA